MSVTDSVGSNGDGLPWQESIGLAACQFAIVLENIQQGRVVKGVENVGKLILLDLKETGRCGKSSSDLLCVSSRET